MTSLAPVAFDIETTGFDPEATITAAGLYSDAGAWLGLNTSGRDAEVTTLKATLQSNSSQPLTLDLQTGEAGLLSALETVASNRIDGDRHYLCCFNGETWRGGFDLPFLRTACTHHHHNWPFPDVAYADVKSMIQQFNTGEAMDLVGVYTALIDAGCQDPFEDSEEVVAAFESGDWLPLLQHNLADIKRTYELAVLAGQYVAGSDFDMKNLAPPTP